MNNINLISAAPAKPSFASAKPAAGAAKSADNPALRKAFDQFVGETFYGQMLKEMRKSQGKVAYVGGGQAEEIFTQQLDQALTKKMSAAGADKLSGPLYHLFTQARK
jgi:Rod binding domain-containing protein